MMLRRIASNSYNRYSKCYRRCLSINTNKNSIDDGFYNLASNQQVGTLNKNNEIFGEIIDYAIGNTYYYYYHYHHHYYYYIRFNESSTW